MIYIGIDVGGTNLAAGAVDREGAILARANLPTKPERGDRAVVGDIVRVADMALADGGFSRQDVEWIGIGSPGSIDPKKGEIIYANNIPFSHTPMRAWIQESWDIPVYIDNDANSAALGEAYAGAARGCETAMLITLGTGIGGGVIIGRRIYSGFNGAGAELGHTVIVHEGRLCTCGRKGCWEAYASATALVDFTREAMERDRESAMWKLAGSPEKADGRTSFEAAKAGDPSAIAVVDMYIGYLACGLTDMVNIFQPEVLCLGGGISSQGEGLLAPVRRLVERDRYTRDNRQTELKLAQLGNDAGIIGAAVLGAQF